MKSQRFVLNIFLLTSVFTLPLLTEAQTLLNQNAKVIVAPNTSIVIKGGVDNQGMIVNNGHVKVSGPWLNSGSYAPGAGEVTFNGRSTTVPQIIHHNGQEFHRVTVSGGTRKIMLSDIVIGREIRFENGIIEGAGNAKVIFQRGVTIVGPSDSSHVHGVAYHRGSGSKLFPLGNGSIYLPVELTDVTDATATIGVQAFEFQNRTLSKSSSLESISDKRYWHIDVESGSLLNSKVVLPLRDESWFDNEDQIVVVESASAHEDFTSIGRSSLEGARLSGSVTSEFNVSKPFVTLASAAKESELVIYNAVSPNGDGLNDYLRIENIENYPGNKLTVFNRWGDKVFEVQDYDNAEKAFNGRSNINGSTELVTGSYFYVLDIPGRESIRGFVAVKN